MNREWRESILLLQDLVTGKTYPENSATAQEHLQCLIECVKEMYNNQQTAKNKLEEMAIKNNGLQNRFEAAQRTNKIEKDELMQRVKIQDREEAQQLAEKPRQLTEDVKEVEQQIKNEQQITKQQMAATENERENAEKLTQCLGDFMSKKAENQIAIKETRAETFEAQEEVDTRTHDINEIVLDMKYYRDYCGTQVNSIRQQGDLWREKLKEQDAKATKAKEMYEDLLQKNHDVLLNKNTINKAIAIEQEKLHGFLLQCDKAFRILNIKKLDFKQAALDTASLEEEIEKTKETNANKLREQTRINEETVVDIRFMREMEEKQMLERAAIQRTCMAQRDFIHSIKKETQNQKQLTIRANQLVVAAMHRLVAGRAERMKYKEQLIMKADMRATMERVYSREFRRRRKILENETCQRKQAEEELEMSKILRMKYEKELETYRRDSQSLGIGNRFVVESLEKAEESLIQQVSEAKDKRDELNLSVSLTQKNLDSSKEHCSKTLKLLEDSLAEKKMEVEDLRSIKDKLEPNYQLMVEEYTERNTAYEDLMKRFHESTIKQNVLVTNNIRIKRKLQVVSSKRAELQPELNSIRNVTLMFLARSADELKNSAVDVFSTMKKSSAMTKENGLLSKGCVYLVAEVTYYTGELTQVHSSLIFMRKILLQLREELMHLIEEEAEISRDATLISGKNMRQLHNVRGYVEKRTRKLDYATQRLNHIVEAAEETANASSLFLVRRRRSYKKERPSHSSISLQKRRVS